MNVPSLSTVVAVAGVLGLVLVVATFLLLWSLLSWAAKRATEDSIDG